MFGAIFMKVSKNESKKCDLVKILVKRFGSNISTTPFHLSNLTSRLVNVRSHMMFRPEPINILYLIFSQMTI